MAPTYTIRDAEEHDLPGILEIINEQVLNSAAIFVNDPLDLANRRAWFRSLKALGHPIFVAVPSSSPDETMSLPTVLGYTAYGPFRDKPGYKYSAETTLYIHECARGMGIGKALTQALIEHARGKMHILIACTSGDNLGSIAFHERLGFERCGYIKEVGLKFGAWQDIVFLQLVLGDPREPKEIASK